jgi:hypothetical protein
LVNCRDAVRAGQKTRISFFTIRSPFGTKDS